MNRRSMPKAAEQEISLKNYAIDYRLSSILNFVKIVAFFHPISFQMVSTLKISMAIIADFSMIPIRNEC